MDTHAIVPLVAMICVFGMPVAIVWVVKHFKLRERELALEEAQQRSDDRQIVALDARIRRLESTLADLDDEMRRRLPPASGAPLLPPRDT